MNVLIVGSAGQLSRSLLVAKNKGDLKLFPIGRPELDLRNPSSILSVIDRVKPGLIVNAAAYTMVDKAEVEEVEANEVNHLGVALLAEKCQSLGVPLLYISTDYVFNGEKKAPYMVEDEADPRSVYGRTKMAGEVAIRQRLKQHLIVRTAWLHSLYGKNFVKTMLNLALKHEEIRVVNDQVGQPTYVPHLADAVLTICHQIKRGVNVNWDELWGTYHLTNRGGVSWFEFAREIFTCSQELGGPYALVKPVTFKEFYQGQSDIAPRPANSTLDNSKIFKNFGVALPSWREGVWQCVQEILSEQNGSTQQVKERVK